MYGHDPGRSFAQEPACTSLTRFTAPLLTPAWVYPTADNVSASPTVVDDTVYVGGQPIPGEDTRLPALRAALRDHGDSADLGALGIGWVLVEHGTPGRVDPRTTEGLVPVHRGPWLDLYRVPGPVATPPESGPPRGPVLAAAAAAVLFVAGCLLWQAIPAGRFTRNRRRGVTP